MLIDTSGWICLLDKDEPRHKEGVSYYHSTHSRITTNYILAELVPLANTRGVSRNKTCEFIRKIEKDKSIRLVWVDDGLHEQGMKLLEARLDKTYSLCDAVSFIVMREYNLTEALTTDRHFKQEGFVRLLE
ncbi:MAG: type II toxin-antitoxin system VapC family toxin [Acidobacteria bacterium]|nr:type II toxin-antitoxin system VapC family toxin [Acidobacteriota bacterium]